MAKRLLLLSLLAFCWEVYAQPAFICDGDFFLSLGTNNTNTGFYRVTVDPLTGNVAFQGFSPGNNSGQVINAMGYRVTDNLIYGVNPGTDALYAVGSDGLAVFKASLNLNSASSHYAGDVKPDGSALVILGANGNPNASREIVTIDLTTYAVSTVPLVLSNGSPSDVNCADIAFDPLTGILYGYDGRDQRLITLDPTTGVIDTSFPANQGSNVQGALYFDAFGELHGYGRPAGGNTQNGYFDINKNTGLLSLVTTGPSASSNDGCSCPYSIEIQHWINPTVARPCDTTFYYIKIANNSGGTKTDLDIFTELPQGLMIDQIVYNPYGGTILSGSGTNILSIQDVSVDVGQDSLVMTVVPQPFALGVFSSQAELSGLPPALGSAVLSDDPFSVPFLDSAELLVLPDTVDLPNKELEFCTGDTLLLDASVLEALVYQWNDGSTDSVLRVTEPGIYWVAATECDVEIDTFIVIENPLPIIDAGVDDEICLRESITLSGTGALGYEWFVQGNSSRFSGSRTPTVSPDSTTAYVVVGTDSNGCQNTDTVQIEVQPLPFVDAGADVSICIYDSILLGTTTDPNVTYSWSPSTNLSSSSQPTPLFLPAAPGTFVLDLTNEGLNGCQDSDQVVVEVNDFDLDLTTIDVDCFGNNNGEASMSVIGASNYTFIWSGSSGLLSNNTQASPQSTINNLFPGNYQGLAIDNNGCADSIGFTISQPAAPLGIQVQSIQDVDCFGNANGGMTALVTGGTQPYEYSINGGFTYQTSPTFGGLGATQYTIQVRDSNSCLTNITDTITSPTNLFGSLIAKKDVRCFGLNDGLISLEGTGGTQPYTLSLDTVNFINSLSLNNLGPGQDTVFLLDANGCLVSIPFELFEPTALQGQETFTRNIDCFGFDTGELQVGSQGGSLPYVFSINGINYQPDSLFVGLTANTYQVIVQDDSLCQDTLSIELTEPPLLELVTLVQKNVDCFGDSTARLDMGANGGTAPYQFSIDSLNFQANGAFDSLKAGSYVVTVVDDSSCVTQLPIEVMEPPMLALSIGEQIDVACFGDTSAFVQLSTLGGSPSYSFEEIQTANNQTDSLFGPYPIGVYDFLVRDDSGCVDQIQVEFVQPPLLELNLISQQNIDCFGNNNGQVQLQATGGVPAYQFQVDGGDFGLDSTFSNMTPGEHIFVLEDDSACQQSLTVDIFEPALLEVSLSKEDVSCYNFGDASILSTPSGGTPPYRYEWTTEPPQFTQEALGLSGGRYMVSILDSNDCIVLADIGIHEPDTLTLELDPSSVVESYCDWPNGSATVFTAGGRLPHTISWNGRNELEGFSVNELYGGLYAVSVIDSSGCVSTIPVDIPETPPAIPFFLSDPSYNDSILLSQANISFVNQSELAVSYVWDFGDGNLSNEENPTHHYLETGRYPVTLTAYNSYFECPVDTTIFLDIIPDGKLSIPTAFTPNGDNINDEFYLIYEGIVSFEFQIFDRWGRLIRSFNTPDEKWNGTSNRGEDVPEGVYVYQVSVSFNNGQELNRGGTITLLR
ncbi:MAG: gliding motility-associated C-terminal domain-containing protein [Bacteroidota bacterium]